MTLQEFTAAVLITRGALADTDGSGLHVVVPPELAARLGLHEYQHLVFEPEANPVITGRPEALRVDYDSPLVEALGGLLDPRSRLAFVEAPLPPLKPIDPLRELERGVTVRNGVMRLRECASVTTTYLCFVLEYEALADERRAGLLELWINPDARSVAEWPGLLETATPRDYLLVSDLGPRLQTASMLARRVAGVMARHDLNDLLESLDRRRAGDVRRLREYFDGIYQEIGRKAKRATQPEARASEMRRLDATRDAYLGRVADVIERYRVQARIWPVMVVGCLVSAYQLRVELLRRRTKSDVTFAWNARDRAIDARCCDGCARPIHAADLCDDRAHWLCPACLAPCPECGRPYCGACPQRCPRPHR
ncbi:MAG: hypothetical protein HYZ58_05735 [Acidobacteria bacterium]|nr:hypothetical protein [Acidobacteriota bacterium]